MTKLAPTPNPSSFPSISVHEVMKKDPTLGERLMKVDQEQGNGDFMVDAFELAQLSGTDSAAYLTIAAKFQKAAALGERGSIGQTVNKAWNSIGFWEAAIGTAIVTGLMTQTGMAEAAPYVGAAGGALAAWKFFFE